MATTGETKFFKKSGRIVFRESPKHPWIEFFGVDDRVVFKRTAAKKGEYYELNGKKTRIHLAPERDGEVEDRPFTGIVIGVGPGEYAQRNFKYGDKIHYSTYESAPIKSGALPLLGLESDGQDVYVTNARDAFAVERAVTDEDFAELERLEAEPDSTQSPNLTNKEMVKIIKQKKKST